jgi:hypothetical protein
MSIRFTIYTTGGGNYNIVTEEGVTLEQAATANGVSLQNSNVSVRDGSSTRQAALNEPVRDSAVYIATKSVTNG